MKKLLLFFITVLIYNSVFSQNEFEQFSLHLNQPIYSSGERIWVSAKMLNYDSTKQQSKVLYITLIDKNNEVKTKQKLLIQNGVAKGDFSIPPSWAEGNYILLAYTLWNLNFGSENIYKKVIPIYSLSKKVKFSNTNQEIHSTRNRASIFQLNISEFQKNQPINLSLNSNRNIKNVSIAIRDWNQMPISSTSLNSQKTDKSNFSGEYPKETSLMVYGTIKDSETEEPVNTGLLSVYGVENAFFARGGSFNGEFAVELHNIYDTEILQFHNLDKYQETVPAIRSKEWELPNIDISILNKSLPKSNDILNYISQRQQEVKLNTIFQISSDLNFELESVKSSSPIANKTYKTADYQLLKNIEEFIDEAIPIARFLKRNKKRTVRLFNDEENKHFPNSPWFLIDGYWVLDEQSVFPIEFKNIESIGLYNKSSDIKKSFEPLLKLNGILELHTKQGKSLKKLIPVRNKVTIEGFSRNHIFNINNSTTNSEDKIPNLRNTIYWEANQVTVDNQISITLPPQNRVGKFVIELSAQTDTGESISEQLFFDISF